MVTTIKGEKYLSIEECIEKLYNFTKGKIKLDKQHFVALIKTYKNQGIDFKTLKHKMHLRLDVFENLMMGANSYDFINRATNLYNKQIGYKEQIVVEPSYRNDENDMEKYSNHLINQYQFENRKIVRVNESQLKRLVENFTDEGGTFYVKNMGHGRGERNEKYQERIKSMDADYRYTDDVRDGTKDNKNIYVDFSKSGLKTHPRNPNWVEHPWQVNNIKYDEDGNEIVDDKYETLDKRNPRDPNKYDNIVKGIDGKYYMPTRQNFGKGDNVKMIKRFLPLGGGQQVICYNLSSLGSSGGSATMMAHFYKGKEVTYRNGITINGKGYENLNGYLRNVINVIKNEERLYNFNPDYIVYPESSSSFNGTISKLLKRFIFKNAEIKPNDWIKKIESWEYDYNDLFVLTQNEVKKMSKQYRGDSYTYIMVYTYISHCKNLLSRKIENEIYDIVSKYCKNISIAERNEKIYNAISNVFMKESIKIEMALAKNNINLSNYDRFDNIFLEVLKKIFSREYIGKYGQKYQKKNAKKNGGREFLFRSKEDFYNHFVSETPDIDINIPKLLKHGKKKDTIKNYDNTGRLAIKGQFQINNDIENIDKSAKFIIIDDNYASGASLRNVVKLLLEKGFSVNNIICLTPGDMNGAGTGGKQGAEIPLYDAEGKLADDVSNNRVNFDDNCNVVKYDGDSEVNKRLKSLSKTLGNKHLSRNKFNNYFNSVDSNFL